MRYIALNLNKMLKRGDSDRKIIIAPVHSCLLANPRSI